MDRQCRGWWMDEITWSSSKFRAIRLSIIFNLASLNQSASLYCACLFLRWLNSPKFTWNTHEWKEGAGARILTELRHLCCSDLSTLSDIPISHLPTPYCDPCIRQSDVFIMTQLTNQRPPLTLRASPSLWPPTGIEIEIWQFGVKENKTSTNRIQNKFWGWSAHLNYFFHEEILLQPNTVSLSM